MSEPPVVAGPGQQEIPLGTEARVFYPLLEDILFGRFSLPAYSSKFTLCPKCRGVNSDGDPAVVASTYHKGVFVGGPCWYLYVEHKFSDHNQAFPEHIDRRCNNCGYEWAEGVVDGG